MERGFDKQIDIFTSSCYSSSTFGHLELECSTSAYPTFALVDKMEDTDSGHRYLDNCVEPSLPNCSQTTVHLELENVEMWKKLYQKTNQMRVTKIGKKLFPQLAVKVTIKNTVPGMKYYITVEIDPLDNKTYTYDPWFCGWKETKSRSKSSPGKKVYRRELSLPENNCILQNMEFKDLRITNHPTNKPTHIVLNTGKFYQIKIGVEVYNPTNSEVDVIYAQSYPITKFISTSECRNLEVTKLKVDNDPHSKGQRIISQKKLKEQIEGRRRLEVLSRGQGKSCRCLQPSYYNSPECTVDPTSPDLNRDISDIYDIISSGDYAVEDGYCNDSDMRYNGYSDVSLPPTTRFSDWDGWSAVPTAYQANQYNSCDYSSGPLTSY